MKKFVIYGIVVVAIGLIVVFNIAFSKAKYGTVEGTVINRLSKAAVWNARIKVDGKSTIKYTDTRFVLTGIKPGSYSLDVEAPAYKKHSSTIEVKKGINIAHISMESTGVPGLSDIIAFTESNDKGIQVEIRLLDDEKIAITNYPAIPATLDVALFVRIGSEENYRKGRLIFEGPVDLFWDSEVELAKNKAIIPWDSIQVDEKTEKYGVLDIVFKTDQGTFNYVVKEVELFKQDS